MNQKSYLSKILYKFVDVEPAIDNTHKTNSGLKQFIWKYVYTAGYLT